MLSQTVEYALRAVVSIATSPKKLHTTADIAEVTKVPLAYLSKVLQAMQREGILVGKRGIGGGFMLSRSPSELTILDIVNAVDPIIRIETCPLGLQTHGKRLCPLHRRMDKALADMESAFGSTTLQEMLDEPTMSPPLCELPCNVAHQSNVSP